MGKDFDDLIGFLIVLLGAAVVIKIIDDASKKTRYQCPNCSTTLTKDTNPCPKCKTPEQLFNWLKPFLRYTPDPPRTELLQSFPTLIKNNFYGIPGAGDCDCYSIAMLAACACQNWKGAKLYIKLVGRNKFCPVHIYTGVEINGKEYNLDLTNKLPLTERNYPYKQKIYLKPLKT